MFSHVFIHAANLANLFKMSWESSCRIRWAPNCLVGSLGIDKLDRSTTSVPRLWQFTCRKGTGFKWQQGLAQTQIMTVIIMIISWKSILIHDPLTIPHPWLGCAPSHFPTKTCQPMACKMLEEVVAIRRYMGWIWMNHDESSFISCWI